MSLTNRALPAASTVVRASLQQLAVCFVAVATLPPLLWLVFSEPLHGWLSKVMPAVDPLLVSTMLIALGSVFITALFWLLVLVRPIRLIRGTERKLRAMAMRDGLTGLLNRDGVMMALGRAIDRKRGDERGLGVMILNFDKFRLINSSLGEASADLLLVLASERIQAVVRETDPVARLAGDQFAILVSGNSGVRGMYVMARNLQRAFEQPFVVESRSAVLTPTIGIAVYGDPARDANELIVNAESAVRVGKQRGGARISRFDTSMQVDSQHEMDINVRLREALHDDQFRLLYQPVVARDGKTIVATEALLRWMDPASGMVSPAEFIPVLEQTGLITQVGHWVLRTACQQGMIWREAGATELVLSVNVSPRQFAEPDFMQTVERVLAETAFPSSRLQLEITEGMLLDPTRDVLAKLDALADLGIRLALDDFGMGYSSLSYLKRYPLHTLKMDQYFVRDLPDSIPDGAIARAIVALGEGLGLHVSAEGVETERQFATLVSMGCDSLQGYLFSKPIEADELSKKLQRQNEQGVPSAALARPQALENPCVRPVAGRVQVLRNGEMLAQSSAAVWVMDPTGQTEPTLFLPRGDVCVRLADSEDPPVDGEADKRRFLDLLGQQDQIVSACIAWAQSDDSPESDKTPSRVAFAKDQVDIEQLPD